MTSELISAYFRFLKKNRARIAAELAATGKGEVLYLPWLPPIAATALCWMPEREATALCRALACGHAGGGIKVPVLLGRLRVDLLSRASNDVAPLILGVFGAGLELVQF